MSAMNPSITLTTSAGTTKQESVDSSSAKCMLDSTNENDSPVAGTSHSKVDKKEDNEEEDEPDEAEEKLLIQPTNLSINKKVIIVDISQVSHRNFTIQLASINWKSLLGLRLYERSTHWRDLA